MNDHAQVEEHGHGPWVVFCWCNGQPYERVRVADEQAARLHRCRLGCRCYHVILAPQSRGVFTFNVEGK